MGSRGVASAARLLSWSRRQPGDDPQGHEAEFLDSAAQFPNGLNRVGEVHASHSEEPPVGLCDEFGNRVIPL